MSELLMNDQGNVRILTLNRPERKNALSDALKQLLIEAMLEAEESASVRVIVLTGSGDVFCSGADLKDMRSKDEQGVPFRTPMNRAERNVYEVVLESKKPVIAALNGSAVAGGFELSLACDFRVSHAMAKFGLPETKIGMGANFGSVVLPRLIGPSQALEMLMTGDYITGEQAFHKGILNRLTLPENVLSESLQLAEKIAKNAPISVRRVKAVALKGLDLPISAALRQDPGVNPYLSEDRIEGIKARLEKRDPIWQNK